MNTPYSAGLAGLSAVPVVPSFFGFRITILRTFAARVFLGDYTSDTQPGDTFENFLNALSILRTLW